MGQFVSAETIPLTDDAKEVPWIIYDMPTGNVTLKTEEPLIWWHLEHDAETPADLSELPGSLFEVDNIDDTMWVSDDDDEDDAAVGMFDLGPMFPAGLSLEELEEAIHAAQYVSLWNPEQVGDFSVEKVNEPGALALLGCAVCGVIGTLRRSLAA